MEPVLIRKEIFEKTPIPMIERFSYAFEITRGVAEKITFHSNLFD